MNQRVAKALLKLLDVTGSKMLVSDSSYLSLSFYVSMGYELNLDDPQTFNEKLQWLKIHDRNPLYTKLVDKYFVKQWAATRIGPEYIIPTLGVWEHFDDIDFDKLPDRFVLKCTHDSGGIAICHDKKNFDISDARKRIEDSLSHNYFWQSREWPYKDVAPRIIAEEYLDCGIAGDIIDYKIMCFGGDAKCAFTCMGRAEDDLRVDFFDTSWKHLPFTRHYPNAEMPPVAPRSLKIMLENAQKLSFGIPFVRVDFYEIDGHCYFGEMTFYPGAGLEEFDPSSWDKRFGSWIDLSKVQ